MTDNNVKERELKAPGYLDGIYILQWTATSRVEKDDDKTAAIDPRDTRKRASGYKVAIQFKILLPSTGPEQEDL